jgi:hypothetical protein
MAGRNRWIPTGSDDVRLVGRTVGSVLSVPLYAAVAFVASFVSLLTIVVAQNVTLIRDLVVFGPLPLEARIEIMAFMLPFVGSGTEPLTGIGMLATSLLVGINLSMLAYQLNEYGLSLAHGSGSFTGVVLGTMGAGCAACGAAVASAVLGLVGAAGIVAYLPLGGLEFLLAAVIFVPLSTYWLVTGIQYGEDEACPVDLG